MPKTSLLSLWAALGLLALGGCGDGGGGGGGDDDAVSDAGAPDAEPNDGWRVLNHGSWSLAPGEEGYKCIIATVPEDTVIGAFKGLTPVGTHHTVLTLYSGGLPDGIVPCSAATNGQTMIYGTGVGTPEMTLPEGVAAAEEGPAPAQQPAPVQRHREAAPGRERHALQAV